MFTGLTQGLGRIERRRPRGAEIELAVTADFDWSPPLAPGESVAVSGVCLTVAGTSGSRGFIAHASAETLRRSTLASADRVNLERALALGDRLGGHLVSGHVDGLGRLETLTPAGASLVLKFSLTPDLRPFVAPKGSIAVDGVSLTVNEVPAESFTVNLIPHTRDLTTLGLLRAGATVNLETDLLSKYVHRLLTFSDRPAEGLSLASLARGGFL
ncbi:MAG: riboflavin synthase [Candidatus Adiutrix sp.]|jgi:riboflavin synthase|nr:riboflavin synthase [Candidatus Adiutrix sp.]